jgi:DNA mismatch repair protein MutS2
LKKYEKLKREKIKARIEEENKPKVILKVGDRVRMKDGKSIGTIDKIEKNKALVNYGIFTSKISIDELEFVQAV